MTLPELVQSLRTLGVLQSKRLTHALLKVDRKHFVPETYRALAYADEALPIGEGQTISQPYTVVFMLELLKPKPGEHIMEIGAGSGWQTALLAELVGETGHVYAIEIVPALLDFARENLRHYPELQERIMWFRGDAALGLPEIAQAIGGFDAIIAAARVDEVPKAWREELKASGRLVYPKESSIFLERKQADGTFTIKEYPGFAFVPLV